MVFRFGGFCKHFPRITCRVEHMKEFDSLEAMVKDIGVEALLPNLLDGTVDEAVQVYRNLGRTVVMLTPRRPSLHSG